MPTVSRVLPWRRGTAPPAVETASLIASYHQRHPKAATELITRAYEVAARSHGDQKRKSGEPYVQHPLAVAEIVARLGLDDVSIAAALLHDAVEDTEVSLAEVEAEFGKDVAYLVDGVTKLDRVQFDTKEQQQAATMRKMLVAIAQDLRVLIIKLADRLHNMRTLAVLATEKQERIARETLDIYAPLAHRLGMQDVKQQLEDLAFASLHPKRYAEIDQMVSVRQPEREQYLANVLSDVHARLAELGIVAEVTGRPKHLWSIYEKMVVKGRSFDEIYDLVAIRVVVDTVKDCYAALGSIHSTWKPIQGRFKDYIAMPKFNLYQSLHTTVIGPGGRPLEIQIRTHEMHRTAEYGVAAHWSYKSSASNPNEVEKDAWLRSMLEWQQGVSDPGEFVEEFKGDLFDKEVFVFTPKGEVRSLAAGATPLDFAYSIHTDLGHRCVGAKVNGRIVPLGYELRSGDRVEVLTGRRERGPSRDWLAMVKTTRARNKIKQWFKAEGREDAERTGRELLQNELRDAGLPPQKITGSPLLAGVVREMGFRRTEDFYVALGGAKISPKVVVTKVLQSLKEGKAAEGDREEQAVETSRPPSRTPRATSEEFGIHVEGVDRVMLRLARCCHPVPGDPIVGYVSLGRGITIHRDDCRNVAALRKDPNRFVTVRWEGEHETAFQAEIHIDAWDRHRLLEDLTRTIAEQGVNIVEVRCLDQRPMVSDRFVVEVGDTRTLKSTIARLRQVEGVFDAYRVTPSA